METNQKIQIPEALADIARGRDFIVTAEFAKSLNISNQTARKNYCLTGHCYGIKPTKFGNKLLWPVEQIALLLKGVL